MSAHLHSVGLLTADLPAALAFYRLLGLAVPDGAEAGPVAAAGVLGAELTLTWGTADALAPLDPARAADPTRRVQVEIGLDAPADVDAAFARATAAGHPGPVAPFDAPWGVRFAVLDDPDGNRVALTAPAG